MAVDERAAFDKAQHTRMPLLVVARQNMCQPQATCLPPLPKFEWLLIEPVARERGHMPML